MNGNKMRRGLSFKNCQLTKTISRAVGFIHLFIALKSKISHNAIQSIGIMIEFTFYIREVSET